MSALRWGSATGSRYTRAMPDPARPALASKAHPDPTGRDRGPVLHVLKIAIRVALLLGVVWLVWYELRSIDFRKVREQAAGVDAAGLWLALLAAAAAIGVMGLYDFLAFPSTPRLPPARRIGLGILFFSWTNFLTLGPIGGPALRLYFYRKAGLETGQILRGLSRLYAGMFGGLGGWVVAALVPIGHGAGMVAVRVALAVALAPALSVLAGQLLRRFQPVEEGSGGASLYARLGLVGAMDWAAALACFIAIGRALGIGVPVTDEIRTVFLGHFVGLVSMMPGGMGSADAIWLKLLTGGGVDPSTAAAHILLFRLIFYIAPWAVSLVGLYVFFSGRTPWMMRWQRRLLSGALALNAAALLAFAATPSLAERLRAVRNFIPLDAAEASHAVAVVTAAVMLFLIRGILRGYRAAFIVAGATLLASATAHMIKGAEWGESAVSISMLLLLLGAHRAFTRRGRIPIGWELTLAATLGSLFFFGVIGFTALHRVRFSQTLWDRIMHNADAARFARGFALVAGVGLVFMLRQAVIPRRTAAAATEPEIERAVGMIAGRSERAAALTVACGDKGVWFWSAPGKEGEQAGGEPDGLAVYQRRGGKLVVFSDPVVEPQYADEFLDDLHAFATDQDRSLVFYQISGDWMQHLHDFGYTFFKLGEEANVPLSGFSLQGGASHGYRKTIRRVEGEGVTFAVHQPPLDDSLIDEARAVSDAWLEHKGIQEMQFSLGYFSPAYLRRFPLAVVRDGAGRMVGFMNILASRPELRGGRRGGVGGGPGAGAPAAAGEVTSDLMRYIPGIDSLMDYMVLKLMVWGAEGGYATLNLGMSPLFDVGEYRRASIPERLARLLFEHGERIYNYRGLHAFKDKFRPEWEPRYMAYQRPWDWPSAVVATTALIWGRSPRDRRRIEAARVESAPVDAARSTLAPR